MVKLEKNTEENKFIYYKIIKYNVCYKLIPRVATQRFSGKTLSVRKTKSNNLRWRKYQNMY